MLYDILSKEGHILYCNSFLQKEVTDDLKAIFSYNNHLGLPIKNSRHNKLFINYDNLVNYNTYFNKEFINQCMTFKNANEHSEQTTNDTATMLRKDDPNCRNIIAFCASFSQSDSAARYQHIQSLIKNFDNHKVTIEQICSNYKILSFINYDTEYEIKNGKTTYKINIITIVKNLIIKNLKYRSR